MRFKVVDSLREAMQVRRLRNECRAQLTNSRDYIGVLKQSHWYFQNYRSAKKAAHYRLYLLYDERDSAVGYGALALNDGKLLITECVGLAYRGRKYGRVILDNLVHVASAEGRDLVAEIWATNVSSLALHRSAGFALESQTMKAGKELQRHLLAYSPENSSNSAEREE
jgi:GNAT superfamily N-acetyltransferase